MTKKRFTVGYSSTGEYKSAAGPFIKFGGKWLRDFGFDVGDKLELIEGRNMLVLFKIPNDT